MYVEYKYIFINHVAYYILIISTLLVIILMQLIPYTYTSYTLFTYLFNLLYA